MFKKLIGTVKNVIDTLAASFNFNPVPEQDPEKLWLITLAAPIANSGWAFINSLETGTDKEILTGGLSQMWGIISKDSAHSTLDWLNREGHRCLYPIAHDIFSDPTQANWQDKIKSYIASDAGPKLQDAEESFEKVTSMSMNYAMAKKDLKNDHGIGEAELKRGILAWDAARVVTLSRQCYDIGLITEDEAWATMRKIGSEVKNTYANWTEYWQAFILGRTLWSGLGESYDDMCDEGDKLLNKEDSPFKTVAW